MEGQKSSNLHYEELVPKPRHKLSRRRSSIGAGTALEVTPENHAIERSTCYNDFAEFTNVAKRSFRRNSLTGATTTDERELKLRHSLAFQKDYPGQSQNIQKLKERFQRRGSLMGNSSGIRSGTKTQSQPSDEEPSMDWTGFSPGGRESMSMPLTEVHQTIQSTRKEDLERKHLIESLVHFSCHIPSAVLEDLISHELDLRKNRNSDEKYSDDDKSDGSLSSLSDDEDKDDNRIDKSDHMAQSRISIEDRLFLTSPSLPRSRERESALLFVDISGFTTLSTLLEVEFLSKVINSYFEMIVEEVISYGGDILKFAGDAFFAEWRIGEENQHLNSKDLDDASSGLMRLNVSLSSSQHFSYRPSVPVEMATADCVLQATKCAASIVTKFSDYLVSIAGDSSLKNDMNGPNEAMLNVHCGIGVGRMVCLHVGDYREDYDDGQDDNAVELRREFLFLGDPINQVSRAAHAASDGEVLASPEALKILDSYCGIPTDMKRSSDPQCIAARKQIFISLEPKLVSMVSNFPNKDDAQTPVYENLRRHCKLLHRTALSRLHLQTALYVHPVVRGDELAITKGATSIPKLDELQSRHLAEAELRSVYTMFIKALISPQLTLNSENDSSLLKTLGNVMHVTSRELDRYSGQLRQFIVDDKGVVLIATFGLRGSTFPDMVANNALPATFDIHQALHEELGVDNKIGATLGQVYCGVVGGIRRHEFSVLGAAVNLAARLMESPMNNGLLVDEAVKSQADARFEFRSLQFVEAKGYDKPVATFEPLHAISSNRRRRSAIVKFTGRQEERAEILGFAREILDNPAVAHSSVINLLGESGIGKSALGLAVMNEVKLDCLKRKKKVINLRSTSTESEQRIPLCAFRKTFLAAIRELCAHDGSISLEPESQAKRYNSFGSDIESDDDISGYEKQERRPRKERQLSWQGHSLTPKVQKIQEPRRSLRGLKRQHAFRRLDSLSSLPKPAGPKRGVTHPTLDRQDSMDSVAENRSTTIPYFDKLCWACDEVGYPRAYANLVAFQFLGLNSSRPITHINGHIPLVAELVEFVAEAFMRITDFADLILVFIDDFQWVDSFTWKVIRALGQSGKKMLLICAMRSHDKQAMRRMSTAVNFRLEITLGPLDLPEIEELISSAFGCTESSINDDICTDMYQRTGGLPVYVIELLEAIKRNKAFSQGEDGKLKIKYDEKSVDKGKGYTAFLESLLYRFDALDVRVRKVLQTCAVLGKSFSLSDLIRVHPDINEVEIEHALEIATEEMILVEITEDDDDTRSILSHSTGGSESRRGSSIEYSKTSSGFVATGDRCFEFSHDMWRTNILTTMLKERKIELHRLIAEAMEHNQDQILQRSDIARLLTLFDHWKSCGDFRKAAPLAVAVGARLNEWELVAQSLDLYQDALDMCFDSVEAVDNRRSRSDDGWVEVASAPEVLDLILRLHVKVAAAQRLMGDLRLCASTLNDAYAILNSSSGPTNRSMMIPILAGLCSVKLELDPDDDKDLHEQNTLIKKFVEVAQDEGNAVHLSRALAMEAAFFAHQGNLERALQDQQVLQMVYKIEKHSARIIQCYEKDYALECFSQSVLWYYLMEQHDKAARQADLVINRHLPYQDPEDIDSIMSLILPAVLVLKSVGRAAEADYIIKTYVINAYHDFANCTTYWVEIFNPICYLLEIVKIQDDGNLDMRILGEIENWVLDEMHSYFSPEHLRLGHTLMGEMCSRLGHLKDVDDPMRPTLLQKARWFLTPIARDTQSEPYLVHTALQILKCL